MRAGLEKGRQVALEPAVHLQGLGAAGALQAGACVGAAAALALPRKSGHATTAGSAPAHSADPLALSLPQSICQLHVEVKALCQSYGVNTGARCA